MTVVELVEELRQVDANLEYLDAAFVDAATRQKYLGYIERGTVFLPYLKLGRTAFAPSRFIGYKNNTLEKHQINLLKDGKKTTPRLSSLLGEAAVHSGLEQEYLLFCAAIGAKPGLTGNRGAPRRFWRVYRTEREFLGSGA